MERLQREFPALRFVKAFNSVGNALMVNPALAGGPPTMFYCGNDADAKAVVAEVLDEVRLAAHGHGHRDGGPRHRAAVSAVVHPRLPQSAGDARVQLLG